MGQGCYCHAAEQYSSFCGAWQLGCDSLAEIQRQRLALQAFLLVRTGIEAELLPRDSLEV